MTDTITGLKPYVPKIDYDYANDPRTRDIGRDRYGKQRSDKRDSSGNTEKGPSFDVQPASSPAVDDPTAASL